jgi:DNA-binding NtrC family response regulator
MTARKVLFADSDRAFGRKLVFLAQNAGALAEAVSTGEEARRALVATSPSLFFAAVRLGGLRGVDLVHLARMANAKMHAILYGGGGDLLLAKEAQRAGALFEPVNFLPHSLARYLTSELPPRDRRDVARIDRRHTFRGGRRATDLEALFRPPR